MRASDLEHATYLLQQLREMRRLRDVVASGGGLGITIQSTYQKEDFVSRVRPAVLEAMNQDIRIIKNKLAALGVMFDKCMD